MPRLLTSLKVGTRTARPTAESGVYAAIYDLVRTIPVGRVATYGQVAELAGFPRRARQVGYALAALPEEADLPWHRVVNARGMVSLRRHGGAHRLQQLLLEEEGVLFEEGRIDLHRYRWVAEGQVENGD